MPRMKALLLRAVVAARPIIKWRCDMSQAHPCQPCRARCRRMMAATPRVGVPIMGAGADERQSVVNCGTASRKATVTPRRLLPERNVHRISPPDRQGSSSCVSTRRWRRTSGQAACHGYASATELRGMARPTTSGYQPLPQDQAAGRTFFRSPERFSLQPAISKHICASSVRGRLADRPNRQQFCLGQLASEH
jgi:hypothetical protein